MDENELQADQEIIQDLKYYVPSVSIRLYRGISFPQSVENYSYNNRDVFTSWSKLLEVAEDYATNDSRNKNSILCDTSLIPEMPHQEQEVMLFPGTYQLNIVKIISP